MHFIMLFHHTKKRNPKIPNGEYLWCLEIFQLWIKQLWIFSSRFLHECSFSGPVFRFLWAWLVAISWKVCGWCSKNLSNCISSGLYTFVFLLVMFQSLSSLPCPRAPKLLLLLCYPFPSWPQRWAIFSYVYLTT